MTLPTFLCLGVEKCGTTWLHELLTSHPHVYVPSMRKEIHFFDRYYERGIEWYEKFFPVEVQATGYKAIGEITPSYLVCEDCPQRMAELRSITRFIVMVRNPTDRAYSHYWHRVRIDQYPGTFEEFLSAFPEAIEWGFYGRCLESYLQLYDRDQFLVLVFEKALADVANTCGLLARFLNVQPDLFDAASSTSVVNRGYRPRFHWLYNKAVYAASYLREMDQDWLINLIKGLGIKHVFERSGSLPQMKQETRERLREIFEPEIERLEALMQIDLAEWK